MTLGSTGPQSDLGPPHNHAFEAGNLRGHPLRKRFGIYDRARGGTMSFQRRAERFGKHGSKQDVYRPRGVVSSTNDRFEVHVRRFITGAHDSPIEAAAHVW